jgi:nucleoside-diphosphate kinase
VPIDSTLCLIKPHVIKEKSSGKILREIGGAGFRVVGLYAIHMTPQMAEELFDVYSNIYPSYSKVVQHITSGPCLAAVVTGSVEVVNEFRAFAGPLNPELAKVLRPDSLRARFGKNDITNGIHCTDLPGDGEMECRYFFETLASL